MSVYVDAPVEYAKEVEGYVGFPRKRARWCHMIADTEPELHEMARRLGLRLEWAQRDRHGVHYDLVPSKRTLAISLGAIAADRRTFVEALRRQIPARA